MKIEVIVFLVTVSLLFLILLVYTVIKIKLCKHTRFEKIAEREILDQDLNKYVQIELKCTHCGEISFKEIKHDK